MRRLAHPQKRVSVGGGAVGVVDLGAGDVGVGGANVSAFGSAAADWFQQVPLSSPIGSAIAGLKVPFQECHLIEP
jgi:hypothetical protein